MTGAIAIGAWILAGLLSLLDAALTVRRFERVLERYVVIDMIATLCLFLGGPISLINIVLYRDGAVAELINDFEFRRVISTTEAIDLRREFGLRPSETKE